MDRSGRASKGWRAPASRSLVAILLAAVFATLPEASPIRGEDWIAVASGVDYRAYGLPGPIRAYVARLDMDQPRVIVESSLGGGDVSGGLEPVSGMANRYDGALLGWGGAWGARGRVLVAINGSSFDPESSEPYGGLLHSGWYALPYGDLAGGTGFVWTSEHRGVIRGCVENQDKRQVVTRVKSGESFELDSVNSVGGNDKLVLFTPQYGDKTPASDGVIEVVVRLQQPLGIVPWPNQIVGTVLELRDGHGETPILFDEVVLAGERSAGKRFLHRLGGGEKIGFSEEITDLGFGCKTPGGFDWSKAYSGIGGGFVFLRDGKIYESDDAGAKVREPRTAVCLNDEFVYFVVVDGRQKGLSRGMSIGELADFCRDKLDATWGLNQDGGGSSAMWVNGKIVNSPSDGYERPVANGLLMMSIEPPARSSRFAEGFQVDVQIPGEVRLGPGTNQPIWGIAQPGEVVQIATTAPDLRGIFANGSFWWKVEVAGELGWIPEQSLVTPLDALAVFEMPTPPHPTDVPTPSQPTVEPTAPQPTNEATAD